MTRVLNQCALLATMGSIGLLLGAFVFQEIFGFEPCTLCIWQRWPHAVIPCIYFFSIVLPHQIWFLTGSLVMVISSLLAGYHAGVEQDWWEGLASCSTSDMGLSAEMIIDFSEEISTVMCNEIVWSFLNLSMAGWNAVLSLFLASLWILAFRKYRDTKQ